jgi:hypothetical protein
MHLVKHDKLDVPDHVRALRMEGVSHSWSVGGDAGRLTFWGGVSNIEANQSVDQPECNHMRHHARCVSTHLIQHRPQDLRSHDEAGGVGFDLDVTGEEADLVRVTVDGWTFDWVGGGRRMCSRSLMETVPPPKKRMQTSHLKLPAKVPELLVADRLDGRRVDGARAVLRGQGEGILGHDGLAGAGVGGDKDLGVGSLCLCLECVCVWSVCVCVCVCVFVCVFVFVCLYIYVV